MQSLIYHGGGGAGGTWPVPASSLEDHKVLASGTDLTPAFLEDKLFANDDVNLATLTFGVGDERVYITTNGRLRTKVTDAAFEYLEDKIVAAGGIALLTVDKGAGHLAVQISGAGVTGDRKVLASSTDTVADYLLGGMNPKLDVHNGIRLMLGGVVGVNETALFGIEVDWLNDRAIPCWDNVTRHALIDSGLSSDGTDVFLDPAKRFIFGARPVVNGAWSMRINGANFVIEKRESGAWVQKGAFVP